MSVIPLRNGDVLTMAAARMARANPVGWEEFRRALAAVSADRAALCVQAPADQVIVAQGRAQQLAELCTLFENAVAQANQLEAKMKEKPRGN